MSTWKKQKDKSYTTTSAGVEWVAQRDLLGNWSLFRMDGAKAIWVTSPMTLAECKQFVAKLEPKAEAGPLTGRVQKYANLGVDHEGSADTAHLTGIDQAIELGFDVVEVKHDGWWARVVVKDEMAQIWSRSGQLKVEKAAPGVPDCTFIGEYLFGTSRGSSDPNMGKVVVFDVIEFARIDASLQPWNRRKALIAEIILLAKCDWLLPVTTQPIADAKQMWQFYVIQGGCEGLVFKNSRHPYLTKLGRLKRCWSMDYVVMGVIEGKNALVGKMGALEIGLWDASKERLVKVGQVGGGFTLSERESAFRDPGSVKGRVLEIKGWCSKALRHPNPMRDEAGGLRWRDDKTPQDCLLGA